MDPFPDRTVVVAVEDVWFTTVVEDDDEKRVLGPSKDSDENKAE